MTDMSDTAASLARETGDHPVVRAMARAGYVASGLLHLLIGWLALRVALGPSASSASTTSNTADQSGALHAIASTSWGQPLLWAIAAGFAGLALWQLTETVGGWHGSGADAVLSRGKAGSKALLYLALTWTTTTFARGGTASSTRQSVEATADLMGQPFGRLLVAAVGAAVIGVGIYHIVKGARQTFLADLVEHPGQVALYAGIAGYIAKGIALIVVGVLFGLAALHGDAGEARGLDGALRALTGTPYGAALLTAVSVGIAAYGLYSLVRARYTRV